MFSIDSVYLHNFKSFRGEHEFLVPSAAGLYLITGLNEEEPRLGTNACGKSTLIDAIDWCLFGRTSRGLRASDILSWGTKTGSVTVNLTVRGQKLEVHRSQNPNQFALGPTAITQEELEEQLHVTARTFNYSVIHPQFIDSFFDLKPAEKLGVFSHILNAEYWLERSKDAEKLRDQLSTDILRSDKIISRNQGQIDYFLADLRRLDGLRRTFNDDQKALIVTKTAAHAELQRQLEYTRGVQTLTSKAIKGFEAKLAHGPSLCPACSQPLPTDDRRAWQQNLDDHNRQLRREERDEARLQAEIEGLAIAIEAEKQRINPYSDQIAHTQHRLEQSQQEISKLVLEAEALEKDHAAVAFWVDGFKRVRLFLVDQTLRQLEVEVNNSLVELGLMNWLVTMDIERENKSGGVTKGFTVMVHPAHNGVEAVKWEAFSGGEGQRLRLAGDLGLANLIMDRAGLTNTIEFYDEPSRHLSQEGLLDVAETLHQRALKENKRIFLVDHNTIDFGNFAGRFLIIKGLTGSRLERL